MTIAPENIHTIEEQSQSLVEERQHDAVIERTIDATETSPSVIGVGDTELFRNDFMRVDENLYALSNGDLFADSGITSDHLKDQPVDKIIRRLARDAEKGGQGAAVVSGVDGVAFRASEENKIAVIGESTTKILEGTGRYEPHEGEIILIANHKYADMLAEFPGIDAYNTVYEDMRERNIPFIAIEVPTELAEHHEREAAALHGRRVKSRVEHSAASPVSTVEAADVSVYENVAINRPKRGFEDADMADLPMTATGVDRPPEKAVLSPEEQIIIEQGQTVRVERSDTTKEDDWTVLGFGPSEQDDDGEWQQPAYVAKGNLRKTVTVRELQRLQAEKAAEENEAATALQPSSESDTPAEQAAPAQKQRDFKVYDNRKWDRDILKQPLDVSRHDMLVDGESPNTNTEQLYDPAIVAAEARLAHIREDIDTAIAEGKKGQKQLPDLWHDYKSQEARLKSLKDGTPYPEPLRVASGPLTMKERAQDMYARAGAEFSSRMFMAKERLPKPHRYENEPDEKYEKRVRRRRGLLLGAAALATAAAATYLNYDNSIDVGTIEPVPGPEAIPVAPSIEISPLEQAVDRVQASGGDIISPDEGFYKTFSDMNINPNHWEQLKDNPGMVNELKQIGFAYDMSNGDPGIIMPDTGKMPEEAARIIIKYDQQLQ